MAGPAEDHAATEITADADHVGTMDRGVMIGRVTTGMTAVPSAVMSARVMTAHVVMMISAAAEGRGVRVALVLNAMTGPVGMIARAEMIDRAVTPGLVAKTDPDAMMTSAVGERRVATADPVMNVTTDCAEIRDRAAVFGTVQLRPHRSVRAIRIRSVPLRSKCLAKFANQTLMRTWCFPTCCASSASWAGPPVSRQNCPMEPCACKAATTQLSAWLRRAH